MRTLHAVCLGRYERSGMRGGARRGARGVGVRIRSAEELGGEAAVLRGEGAGNRLRPGLAALPSGCNQTTEDKTLPQRWYEKAGLLGGKLLSFPLTRTQGCKGDRHEKAYHQEEHDQQTAGTTRRIQFLRGGRPGRQAQLRVHFGSLGPDRRGVAWAYHRQGVRGILRQAAAEPGGHGSREPVALGV